MLKSLCIFLVFLLSTLAFTQKKDYAEKKDKLDDFIKNWMKKDSVPGIFLMIAKDGQVLKQKGYGYANLELKTKPQSNTVFEIGAITQMFTAAAICMLEEQKKIDLDSSITKYIDSLPQGWKLATVRNLLYHSHGLNPEHFDKTLLHGQPGYRYTVREQLFFFKPQRQYALAGTAAYYTDAAFFLLGVIIQNVSRMSYEDFIQKNIFDKAGMKNSSFINRKITTPNQAQGYTLHSGKWIPWMLEQNIQSLDCNSFTGILSNAENLLLFDKALRDNSLVKKETYQQILEPFILPDGRPASSGRSSWGMGCLVRDIQGHQCVFHTGITGTGFYRFPKDGLTVVVFTNLGNGDDFLKDKGADMPITGYNLAEEVLTDYLLKK